MSSREIFPWPAKVARRIAATPGTAANQYGVLGTAVAPSFRATAGYDLATGLGTVNVANLATAWATAGLTATTTTITASPSGAIAHGSNASFSP